MAENLNTNFEKSLATFVINAGSTDTRVVFTRANPISPFEHVSSSRHELKIKLDKYETAKIRDDLKRDLVKFFSGFNFDAYIDPSVSFYATGGFRSLKDEHERSIRLGVIKDALIEVALDFPALRLNNVSVLSGDEESLYAFIGANIDKIKKGNNWPLQPTLEVGGFSLQAAFEDPRCLLSSAQTQRQPDSLSTIDQDETAGANSDDVDEITEGTACFVVSYSDRFGNKSNYGVRTYVNELGGSDHFWMSGKISQVCPSKHGVKILKSPSQSESTSKAAPSSIETSPATLVRTTNITADLYDASGPAISECAKEVKKQLNVIFKNKHVVKHVLSYKEVVVFGLQQLMYHDFFGSSMGAERKYKWDDSIKREALAQCEHPLFKWNVCFYGIYLSELLRLFGPAQDSKSPELGPTFVSKGSISWEMGLSATIFDNRIGILKKQAEGKMKSRVAALKSESSVPGDNESTHSFEFSNPIFVFVALAGFVFFMGVFGYIVKFRMRQKQLKAGFESIPDALI